MRQIWIGCILLLTAASSSAVTLGRHSGAAVIGRPLDIRVQVLTAPGEDAANLCIESDVFYGDSQVSSASVRSTQQKTAPDAQSSVRIQASSAVNEPIVTVYVRAGCTTPFTRRYVLLADPISEPTTAPAQFPARSTGGVSASAVPPVSAVTAAALPPAADSADAPGDSADGKPDRSRIDAAPTKPAPKAVRPPTPKPRAPSVVRKPAEPAPKATPRLQLDPVDLSLNIERDPVLRLSLTMLSEPATSEEERAAAGLLWKAINASPEEILRDAQKLSVLEAESKGLRAEEEKNKAAINELSSNLEQAKSERYLNWVVYLLGSLLLLALLGLVMLWRRRSRPEGSDASAAWWAAVAGEEKKVKPARFAQALESESGADVDIDLDLDLDLDQDSNLGASRAAVRAPSYEESGPASLLTPEKKSDAASRSVATEELFDLQQQADFFISLGEDDKAIEVLRNHLQESQEPSPLSYLDLFKLYHKLGRRDDYERLREDFNHVFNAGAPPYDQYSDQSRSLEDYETAFSRIEALWPQPKVLDVIEQSIFRAPGDDDMEAEVFDLEAYRELLLLHAIAKDMIRRDAAKANKGQDFAHTSLQPLKAASKVVAPVAGSDSAGRSTEPMDATPPASPNLGLDIDLSDISEFSAFEASLPEVPVPVLPSAKPLRAPGAPKEDPMGNLIDFEVLDFTPPEDDQELPEEPKKP